MPSRADIRLSGLEYKTIFVGKEAEDLCISGYRVFGWVLLDTSQPPPGNSEYLLTFCRNQIPEESPDIVRLRKRFDSCIHQINSLEKIKMYSARYVSITVGMFGLGLILASALIYPISSKIIDLALFAAGVGQLIATWFVYRWIQKTRESEIEPLINQKKNESIEVITRIQWMRENGI